MLDAGTQDPGHLKISVLNLVLGYPQKNKKKKVIKIKE